MLNNLVILRYPDGRFVRLSDGYPYPTNNFHEVRIWKDEPEATKYANMFSEEHMELAYATITISNVKE